MKDKRIGIYICHCGGNISDYVDTAKAAEILSHDPNVVVAKDFIFMCSDPGQNMIYYDIMANNLTHVVVASCSPRLHEMTFQKVVSNGGINPFTYRHANIREQVSWVHSHNEEAATEKAIRLIRGAVANATQQKELKPIQKEMLPIAAVVGGGVSGMTAAIDLSSQGHTVHLIEQEDHLGGHVLELDKLYPDEIDAKKFVQNLVSRVDRDNGIFVHLNTKITETKGTIGNFTIRLESTLASSIEDHSISLEVVENDTESALTELHVGTVTLATGHNYYEPLHGEFGYGESEFVITLPNLISYLNSYKGDRLIYHGKEINSIAMIHCVGSRQIEGVHKTREGVALNKQCSRTCCTATLQQANRLKERYPKLQIFDFYRDIRTYGDKEKYYKQASQNNVIFIKYPGEKPPIVNLNGVIHLTTIDELTYGLELDVEADLVVLAVAMVPQSKPQIIEDLSIPVDENNYLLEGHVKLKPVESATDGIFLAGTAQGPKNVKEATMSASATSAKAGTLLRNDVVELSPNVALVDVNRCTGCGDCISQCEYNAISLVPIDGDKKQAVVTPSLCVGCGACVPVCNDRAIEVQGFEIETLTQEVRAMIQEVKIQ